MSRDSIKSNQYKWWQTLGRKRLIWVIHSNSFIFIWLLWRAILACVEGFGLGVKWDESVSINYFCCCSASKVVGVFLVGIFKGQGFFCFFLDFFGCSKFMFHWSNIEKRNTVSNSLKLFKQIESSQAFTPIRTKKDIFATQSQFLSKSSLAFVQASKFCSCWLKLLQFYHKKDIACKNSMHFKWKF